MFLRAILEKLAKTPPLVASWAEVSKTTPALQPLPVPVSYQHPRRLTAREQGEWYLHTVIGR